MAKLPPIDVSQFRADVDEALAAFLVDDSFACEIARRAARIKLLRQRGAALTAARRAAKEAEERVSV